jgi:hypothetical protein
MDPNRARGEAVGQFFPSKTRGFLQQLPVACKRVIGVLSGVLSSTLLLSYLRRSWYRFHAALLGMQFCRLHVMVSRVPVSVSKVCVMRRLFVLVGLVIFRCFVEMVSRFLMVMSGVMIMFPSL